MATGGLINVNRGPDTIVIEAEDPEKCPASSTSWTPCPATPPPHHPADTTKEATA